jgi:hypothetical protein
MLIWTLSEGEQKCLFGHYRKVSKNAYLDTIGEGSRVSRVFVDFGRGRVYALPEDGEEVMIFGDFLDV